MTYLYLFLQSNFLELPFYLFLVPSLRSMEFARGVTAVTVLNSLTHPIVFFGILNLPLTHLTGILCAEAFAIVAEALALQLLLGERAGRAWGASTLANLVSWQVAPVLTYLVFR